MKNRIRTGLAFMLIIGLAACEKTYMEPDKKLQNKEAAADYKNQDIAMALRDRITNGVWKISSFQWKLKESNDQFKTYLFYFQPNEVVIAVHDNIKEQGRWEKKENTLMLEFSSAPLRELNNKWDFKREAKDEFMLRGLSPFDNSTEFVVFER